MSTSKYSILARYFFDLADKIEEVADSEVAQAVDTFGEEDYGSLVASHLDAAYWILAGDLDPGIVEEDHGLDFYVASSVYNDLLYRGYKPEWAWEESGLGDMLSTDVPEDGGEDEMEKAASAYRPGDYVRARLETGLRVGLVTARGDLFAFDGVREPIPATAEKISKEAALSLLQKHSDKIIAAWRAKFAPAE